MIAVGDRFIPREGGSYEEIEVTSTNALPRVFVKRVRDGLTWDMNESTIAMQWTPIALPAVPAGGADLVGTYVNPEGLDAALREASGAVSTGVAAVFPAKTCAGCGALIPAGHERLLAQSGNEYHIGCETKARPAPRLGDELRRIADMLDERERLYGPAVTTWERIARVVGITTEQALGVMLAMKRERAMFSPENPDHVRDQIGYLAILQAVRAAR